MNTIRYSRVYRGHLYANPRLLGFFALLLVSLTVIIALSYFKYTGARSLGERVLVSWSVLDAEISTYAEALTLLNDSLRPHNVDAVIESSNVYFDSASYRDKIRAAEDLLIQADALLVSANKIASDSEDQDLLIVVSKIQSDKQRVDGLIKQYNESLGALREHVSGSCEQMFLVISGVGHYTEFK